MSWRDNLVPASYNGVEFHVEVGAKTGGRRNVPHEYPKRDTPYAEDMGRRGKRFTVQAYVIGDDYTYDADLLDTVMDQEGPGLFVHPTMGEFLVNPDGCVRQEARTRGNMAEFELSFLEAGSSSGDFLSDTAGAVNDAASNAGSTSAASLDKNLSTIST